ncbi:MAG: hypothetical protein IPI35_29795 [Deltaproteobacteria bacterium]|nr:hypothetical protein [Deltaproteobacteria bacterium]
MTPTPLLLLGALASAHRSVAPLPAVAAPAAPSPSLPASGTVEPALSSASGAPTAPTLVPGDHAHNRRVSIDYLVRALIWDITRNYRIDPEQYGSRPHLLYIPVATYSVQKDEAGLYVVGNDCVELIAQQLSDALASPTDFPPFLYQAVPEHPPCPRACSPRSWGTGSGCTTT